MWGSLPYCAIRRGAAAASRLARDRGHVLGVHHRAADQRHPRPGHVAPCVSGTRSLTGAPASVRICSPPSMSSILLVGSSRAVQRRVQPVGFQNGA
jgi:hypothetical protein